MEIQEIPDMTGKFGLGLQNEIGKRITEFCQEIAGKFALIIANTLFPTIQEKALYMDITRWSTPKSD